MQTVRLTIQLPANTPEAAEDVLGTCHAATQWEAHREFLPPRFDLSQRLRREPGDEIFP